MIAQSATVAADHHVATPRTPLEMLQAASDIDIVDRIDLAPKPPRYQPVPAAFRSPLMLSWIRAMTGRDDLRRHQSLALEVIAQGDDLVVATGTASGKSLIYQIAAIKEVLSGGGVMLALYPLKALASDQLTHWRRALTAADLPQDLVVEITGDTPMAERNDALASARIIIATPDVIHSWLMRQIAAGQVRTFLDNLRFLVLDETHVLESELGSNCAFLIRRLQAAQLRVRRQTKVSRPGFQIIATTATIANPADHLRRLSGREFAVIDEVDNGAPASARTLLHIDGPAHGAGAERMVAGIASELADEMGDATFIVFHDSRQGVERITRMVGRDDVLPYRSGYEAGDRRQIESALREGHLRGVIATSSLELGIDIPQFAIGFTIGIPNSRKTFRQRMGRVGRTRAGLFAVIAPAISFAQLGSSLTEFSEGEPEPSPLYLDNPFIQFAQARCLIEECEAIDETARLPDGVSWPDGFERSFALAMPGASRPRDLDMIAAIGADAPHLNYPLRHVCETNYALKDVGGSAERFGTIGLHQAIREAYPGATYYHFRQACKVREWRSTSFERSVRIERVRSAEPTMPLLRKQVNVSRAAHDIIDRRERAGERGFLAELHVQVNESVEGFRTSRATMLYSELRKSDPRMTRKQRDFASTGVVLQICEPWFAGTSTQQVQTRQLVARAFKELLVREHCLQPKDIDFAEMNVAVHSAAGPRRLDDAICVYDTIFGSLRLSAPLFDELPDYVERLSRAAGVAGEAALVPEIVAEKLRAWYGHLEPCSSPAPSTRPDWQPVNF